MTDDLVKRLRLIGEKRLQCTACYKFIETADEAADRIEKLEAALRMVVDWDNTLEFEDSPAWGGVMEVVQKALEQTK